MLGLIEQEEVKEHEGTNLTNLFDPLVHIATNLEVLYDNLAHCTRIPNRKPRGPFTGKEEWRGENRMRQIVIRSRKALYCSMGRIGSSRWKSLMVKVEGLPPESLPKHLLYFFSFCPTPLKQ